MNSVKFYKQSLVNTLLDDKKFIKKFITLLVGIILVSILGVMQDREKILFYSSEFSMLKLEDIEKSLSGNINSSDVVESDFDNLSELDLSYIELVNFENKSVEKRDKITSNVNKTSKTVKKPKNKVIITSGSIKSLSLIKKRFYATNSIKYSLLIAQKFFENKRYKKALKWALISNEINDKDERSWILFAKIKVKMGKKYDAINALKAYLKKSKSSNIEKLLNDISKSS